MTLPFPIVLTFKKEIDFNSFNDEQIRILTFRLESKTVDIVKTTEKLIEFDVPFFRFVSNLNIMGPVDHGHISIENIHGTQKIIYKVSFLRFCIMAVVLSVIMGLISSDMNFFLLISNPLVNPIYHLVFRLANLVAKQFDGQYAEKTHQGRDVSGCRIVAGKRAEQDSIL